jgi:hypothetical protein
VCPQCGAEVPVGKPACPECGSDADTGWKASDEIDYQSVEIPDYWEEPAPPRRLWAWTTLLALVLVLAFRAWAVFWRR